MPFEYECRSSRPVLRSIPAPMDRDPEATWSSRGRCKLGSARGVAASAFFEVSQDFEGSPQFRIATVTIDDTEHRLPRGRAALDGVSESGELLSVGDAIYTSFASDVGVILSPNVDSTVSIVATETLFEGLALDADSAAVDEALRAARPISPPSSGKSTLSTLTLAQSLPSVHPGPTPILPLSSGSARRHSLSHPFPHAQATPTRDSHML